MNIEVIEAAVQAMCSAGLKVTYTIAHKTVSMTLSRDIEVTKEGGSGTVRVLGKGIFIGSGACTEVLNAALGNNCVLRNEDGKITSIRRVSTNSLVLAIEELERLNAKS